MTDKALGMDSIRNEYAVNTEESKKEEKLTIIMEAANALTALADEDETAGTTSMTETATGSHRMTSAKVEADQQASVDKPTGEEIKQEPSSASTTTRITLQPETDGTTTGTVISSNSGGTGMNGMNTAVNGIGNDDNSKRYLPEHKKPDAAPTFPEKMMALMRTVDEHRDDPNYCAAWLPEGKSFVVRNPDEFARQLVPKYFKATKFSSFTRKLYRWGFRQINRGIGPDDPVIFGNEYFERDNEALMSQMRSITAAGTRKTESRMVAPPSHPNNMYGKRPFDVAIHHNMYDTFADQQKRYLYEQFMHQQKSAQMMQQQHYGGMNTNGPMHMSHHSGGGGLGMDPGYPAPHHMIPPMNGKPYDMMPPMHPDGPSMMMNMAYNPIHHQQQQQQQQQQPTQLQHSPPQHQQQRHGGGGIMDPSNLATPIQNVNGTLSQMQHIDPSTVGTGMAAGSRPSSNNLVQATPPHQSQPPRSVTGGDGGGGGGSTSSSTGPGPHGGGYTTTGGTAATAAVGGGGCDEVNTGGGTNSSTGNQNNTSEIVNAAIRALQYSS